MKHRSSLASLLGLAMLAACSGPNRPPVAPTTGRPAPAPASADAGPDVRPDAVPDARAAARAADLLRAQIAIDRQAVETAQQSLVHQNSLYAAGRVTRGEVLEAEIEVLERQRQLHLREQELAALGEAAAAPDGDRPPARD